MVMSNRALRIGVAEAKARFAEVVGHVDKRRTIIQKRGKDVAVLIGIGELARLEDATRGATVGARLLERLGRAKGDQDLSAEAEPVRIELPFVDPFAPAAKKKRA